MTQAQAFIGSLVDHLILECPFLVRAMRAKVPAAGVPTFDWVDVDGSDLCKWCVRVWKVRNRESCVDCAGTGKRWSDDGEEIRPCPWCGGKGYKQVGESE